MQIKASTYLAEPQVLTEQLQKRGDTMEQSLGAVHRVVAVVEKHIVC